MRLLPFVLFVCVPIVEIYILIQVGGAIGALPTVGLILLTAALGAWMLRQQGMATLQRARVALDSGQPPARELLEGVVLLIGGALLLTPGFVTDTLGFICLLPQTRHWLLGKVLKNVRIVQPRPTGPGSRPSETHTIEGEWRREDD